LHAEALERLGEEIGKITERLTDRIIQSERRAAQAIDDVGEQVAKVTERIEQRHERASSDLAERLRASEERTARLLESARLRLDGEVANPPEILEPETFEPETFGPEAAEAVAAIEIEDTVESEETLEAEAAFEADELHATAEAPEPPLPPAVFGAALFSRAEPIVQPALDPANPTFGAEDFEAADGFIPIAETAADRLEIGPHLEPDGEPATAERETPALSTREVIEQARATARAAAASRPAVLHASERRARPARSGLFSALKPGRPVSTWQTALMVAGGAAFLSVGAAGVVLMEGPGVPREIAPFAVPPRAALALTPGPTLPQPEAIASPAPAADHATPAPTAADAVAGDYVATVKAVEQKKPGALAHLKVIAETGHPPAQLFLARLYETGQGGVTQNLVEARRWTARAADAGDPSAMHNLALYYFRGEGGPQDSAAAGRWFKQAAERGVVDSQYNLGLLYASGSGLPKDAALAYKWFSIAANAGDGEARAAAVELEPKLPTAQLAAVSREVTAFQPDGVAPGSEPLGYGPPVAAAQKILGRLGYYKGKPDGANSHDLKLAVIAYQRDQGLAATGSLDPVTVSRLSVFNR
jgi:localization factor PodJL